MGRIWALAGGLILGLLIILLLGPLGGLELQLTSALCVGAGAAAAYLGSPSHMLARGLWLLVGVLLGALGFALAAALEGVAVSLYFQGPAVRVLTRGFHPRLRGWARPFSRFAAAGMTKSGHIPAQAKLQQLRRLGSLRRQ